MVRSKFLGPLAVLVSLGVATVARATVMVEVPLERMVAESSAIVLGRVERVGVRLELDAQHHATPHTVSVVRVSEWLRGPGTSELVTIDEIGGTSPTLSMAVAGTPEYRRGEEVVVFLRALGGDRYRTFAMAQGHFEILRGVPGADDVVVRDTSAIGLASWEHGPMTITHGHRSAMRLAHFLGYVRTTLEQVDADLRRVR